MDDPNDVFKLSQHIKNIFIQNVLSVKDPFQMFKQWYRETSKTSTIDPNIMCLSTATKDGIPSSRMMLCTECTKEGFKFFTDYKSRKGTELEQNPVAAMTFFWPPDRSVRIEGRVEKLPLNEADEFFKHRPYEHQIDALCCEQSKMIESKKLLADKAAELREKYPPGDVPRPSSLGGFILKPRSIEYYQTSEGKMQDRIRFRRPDEGESLDGNKYIRLADDGWVYELLAP